MSHHIESFDAALAISKRGRNAAPALYNQKRLFELPVPNINPNTTTLNTSSNGNHEGDREQIGIDGIDSTSEDDYSLFYEDDSLENVMVEI